MESLSEFGLCKNRRKIDYQLLSLLWLTFCSHFWLKFRQVGNTSVESRSHFYGYGCQDPLGLRVQSNINYDHDRLILSLKKR
jgi:hypothetical protein